MEIATAFLQAGSPAGFLLVSAFAGILATLVLLCVFTLRH